MPTTFEQPSSKGGFFMKFFVGRYWEMINSSQQTERESGDRLWSENVNRYLAYYDSVKHLLPKSFLDVYTDNANFHDFYISAVKTYSRTKGMFGAVIDISGSDKSYQVFFSGVTLFRTNIVSTDWMICGKLSWGYSELELLNDGLWRIGILCDVNCEIEIQFRRVAIKDFNDNAISRLAMKS
jgi:hypothetical protein